MTSPTHSHAQSYLQRGIFDGLKSFRELEARISALATTHERGAAFEVFVEAYLATLAVEKAKAIWPGSRITPSLCKRLALRPKDMGVDGVMETQLGELHAYQAKFRTGRPVLIPIRFQNSRKYARVFGCREQPGIQIKSSPVQKSALETRARSKSSGRRKPSCCLRATA